jgi:hypothetical protein
LKEAAETRALGAPVLPESARATSAAMAGLLLNSIGGFDQPGRRYRGTWQSERRRLRQPDTDREGVTEKNATRRDSVVKTAKAA